MPPAPVRGPQPTAGDYALAALIREERRAKREAEAKSRKQTMPVSFSLRNETGAGRAGKMAHKMPGRCNHPSAFTKERDLISQNRTRGASIAGMVGAGLWLIALFLEYGYGLQPPGNGSALYYASQAMFFAAMLCYGYLLFGLLGSGAAGNGVRGKVLIGLWVASLVALLISQAVQLFTGDSNFFLFPVGGLVQMHGGLLTGMAVVREKRWTGWQRFAPLLQGLYYLLVLFLPLFIADQEPSLLTEGLWQVTWFVTSYALYTNSK